MKNRCSSSFRLSDLPRLCWQSCFITRTWWNTLGRARNGTSWWKMPIFVKEPVGWICCTRSSFYPSRIRWKKFYFVSRQIYIYIGIVYTICQQCASHTYQLSVDMQLSLLAPLLVYVLNFWPTLGTLLVLFTASLSTIFRYTILMRNNVAMIIHHGFSWVLDSIFRGREKEREKNTYNSLQFNFVSERRNFTICAIICTSYRFIESRRISSAWHLACCCTALEKTLRFLRYLLFIKRKIEIKLYIYIYFRSWWI